MLTLSAVKSHISFESNGNNEDDWSQATGELVEDNRYESYKSGEILSKIEDTLQGLTRQSGKKLEEIQKGILEEFYDYVGDLERLERAEGFLGIGKNA